MNKLLISILAGAFFIGIFCGPSFSYTYTQDYNWNDIWDAIGENGSEIYNFDYTGNYYYSGVGFEAGHRNAFFWTGQEESEIYNNYSTGQGANYGIWSNSFSWSEMAFVDYNDGPDHDNTHIKVFLIDEDWTFGATTWTEGTFIIGWGDGAADGDFDDLIIAAIPNPEPTTMLLLGFGLLGFARVARSKK